ncbi:hypothetical protein AUP68_12810 [Ilyonectria robusta]
MLVHTLIGAVGLATAAQAAPKGTEFNMIRSETAVPRDARDFRGRRVFRPRVAARADSEAYAPPPSYFPDPNLYNTTNTSISTSSHPNTETIIFGDTSVATIGCPTASLFVSTTTVDITVFITATSNFTYTNEPYDDEPATTHNTKASAHLSSVSTDCDDETAPGYTGPKTATIVEEHHSTETEPCSEDLLYPMNSTMLHSLSTRTAHTGVYHTDAYHTDTEEPCTDDPSFPANETGRPPHYTAPSLWSTTLSTHVSPTSDCDDETSASGEPGIVTPDSTGYFSTPHATPVASTEPCDNETSTATPSSHPHALYTLPFGGSNTTYTTPESKPAESTEPCDDTSSSTPTSANPGLYTSGVVGNYSTPRVTPVESSKPNDDKTSSATPTTRPAPIYTLPFGDSNTTYPEPSESPKPYYNQSTSATSSRPAPIYTLPSGNSNTYVKPTESPTTYHNQSTSATPTSHSAPFYTIPFGNTNTYVQPYESPKPYHNQTTSATLTSEYPSVYTPVSVGSSSTPQTTPVTSTESRNNSTAYMTPTSHSAPLYTLPFGNSNTYVQPSESPKPYFNQTTSSTATSEYPVTSTPVSVGNSSTPYTTPAASTEPCDDETSSVTSASEPPIIVFTPTPFANYSITAPNTKRHESTEPCDDETTTPMTSSTIISNMTPTTPYNDETMTPSAIPSSSTEPCDDDTTTTWTSTVVPGNTTASSPPSSSTEPCDETSTTKPVSVTPFLSSSTTTSASSTSETPVIDTYMVPVSTPVLNTTPTYPLPAKETICEHTVQPGSPSKDTTYCGVHGTPASTYFISEFTEERPGVPVSLEDCYQFCISALQTTRGCQSYRYYTNSAGAPRCALYGLTISKSVRELDSSQSDVWYDLTCGSPSEEAWHSDMPTSHQDEDDESLLNLSIDI